MPFELPSNYPLLVEEALEKKFLNGSAFTKFIMAVSSNIFYHKSHPTKVEYHHLINQILKKYPFMVAKNKKGSGDHYEFLEVALRDKMKYLRNVKPRRKTKDSKEVPSAQKKPRAHYPQAQSVPATLQPVAGEDKASHLRHVKMLQMEERKVSPDKNAITELMK